MISPISFINQKVSFRGLQEVENDASDSEIHFEKMTKQKNDSADTFEGKDSKFLTNEYGVKYDPDNLCDPNNPFSKDYTPPSSSIYLNA